MFLSNIGGCDCRLAWAGPNLRRPQESCSRIRIMVFKTFIRSWPFLPRQQRYNTSLTSHWTSLTLSAKKTKSNIVLTKGFVVGQVRANGMSPFYLTHTTSCWLFCVIFFLACKSGIVGRDSPRVMRGSGPIQLRSLPMTGQRFGWRSAGYGMEFKHAACWHTCIKYILLYIFLQGYCLYSLYIVQYLLKGKFRLNQTSIDVNIKVHMFEIDNWPPPGGLIWSEGWWNRHQRTTAKLPAQGLQLGSIDQPI